MILLALALVTVEAVAASKGGEFWVPFTKANNQNNKVSYSGAGLDLHSVRAPCDGGWFKLYYNTGHFEIFANNRGNLFCKNAGNKGWYGGAVYNFNFAKQACVNGHVQFDVVKTSKDFTVYVNGKQIYHKGFDSSNGDCFNHNIDKITTYVYDSRPLTFYIGHTNWVPFAKGNNNNNKVTYSGAGLDVHSVKAPCSGGWFKLYYNTGHFEIFANNRGNLFCKNAGNKRWYGGAKYDFSFTKECVNGFAQLDVVKTANDFSVYNNGKRIYHKTFDGSSGDCLNTHINKVTTYVYDSRPMTFYIGNTGWTAFRKENNIINRVTFSGAGLNAHSVKTPCVGGWFKLYYNTGHFEIFANNKGNLFCKNAGNRSWHGGAVYNFNFAKQDCVDGFVQFDVFKTATDFTVSVNGKQLYQKKFDSTNGDCFNHNIDNIRTYVYDKRPMTFYIETHH